MAAVRVQAEGAVGRIVIKVEHNQVETLGRYRSEQIAVNECVRRQLRILQTVVAGTGNGVGVKVDADNFFAADFFQDEREIAAAAAHVQSRLAGFLFQHEIAEKRTGQAKIRRKYVFGYR